MPLQSATVNGQSVSYSISGGAWTWRYDGETQSVIIETGDISTSNTVNVQATAVSAADETVFSSMTGMIRHASLAKQNWDQVWYTPGAGTVKHGNLSILASAGDTLSYYAGTNIDLFNELLENMTMLYKDSVKEINKQKPGPPSPPGALTQLWKKSRTDNCLCGTPDCLNDNTDYTWMRIEGYQPDPKESSVIPLYAYWNGVNDNYATTNATTPAGYTPAMFSNGYALSAQKDGTVCLQVYWNEDRKDMLTVASDDGVRYAKKHNYKSVAPCVGYVYKDNPNPKEDELGGVPLPRWLYAVELMSSAVL